MLAAFSSDEQWTNRVNQLDLISKITKQEVIDFVKANYGLNYVVVYKRTGEDKNIQKVEKPQITPVAVNREDQSLFLKSVVGFKTVDIQPQFIDYKTDIKQFKLPNGANVTCTKNTENNTFDLYYIFEMGSNHDKELPIVIEYLQYIGTSDYKPDKLQEEFYKLGCTFNVFNSTEQVYVNLNGLTENFEKALQLFESLLNDPKEESEALDNLVGDILKRREDAKLDKNIILRQALYNYGIYGSSNPFTNSISEADLKQIKPSDLIAKIKSLESYQHTILYYGPMNEDALKTSLIKLHKTPATFKEIPAPKQFKELETVKNVYVVEYDMKQAEIIMISKGGTYDATNAPYINLYNEYFGGGMSGIVFQELRESRALAYSASSIYRSPAKKDKPYFLYSYIGTQSDKLPEAMSGLTDLLNNLPKSDVLFSAAKEAILNNLRTDRVIKAQKLFNYEQSKKLGLETDIRKMLFEKTQTLTFNDILSFQEKNIKNKPLTVLILGKKENLNMDVLSKYGKVIFLTLKDVFGY